METFAPTKVSIIELHLSSMVFAEYGCRVGSCFGINAAYLMHFCGRKGHVSPIIHPILINYEIV
jgi:hypothetical protein